MSEEPKIEKYHCNSCGQPTRHFVRGEHSNIDEDEEYGVSVVERLLIVECCGCEHFSFVRKSHFSEDVDYRTHPISGETQRIAHWEEELYPPPTYRVPPQWFEDLPDETMRDISKEIYKSLQTESMFLAAFGSRTLLDRLIVLTVGDQHNFKKGLQALLDKGIIGQHERDILEPIVQAGHAAAHRGWAPNRDQLKTILDTVENLVHRLLVLPKLAEELEEAVPGRNTGGLKGPPSTLTMKQKIEAAPQSLKAVHDELHKTLCSFGEDVTVRPQKHYVAYKRSRNFASLQIYNQKRVVRVYLNIDPTTVSEEREGVRDVRQVGHYGTGDLELTIKSRKDIERLSDLLRGSYDNS